MKRYFKKNGYHFVLTFNKKQVTFFSRSEFKGKDEAGNTHIIYGEESGVFLNDVVDGIIMYDTSNKQIGRDDYLTFISSLEKLESISEFDLSSRLTLSIHGVYADHSKKRKQYDITAHNMLYNASAADGILISILCKFKLG
ncbi:MAG TPA: hypothetical protein PK110_14850 [Niabella sp.]|nr:hypothetical protein [Niabella sp.]